MAFAPGSLSDDAAAWKGQSLVGVQQLDEAGLNLVLTHAERLRGPPRDKGLARQRGKILANVFYEPSTRTSCSFQAAMLRLGGSVFCVAEATSSAKKGETLEDTARSLACYADVLVLRHPESGAAKRAAVASQKPTLNAGDGVGEHPTQALLDVYTLCREMCGGIPSGGVREALAGKTVCLVGDLKHGRTVHSLAKLLSKFDVALIYVAPTGLEMPSVVTAVVRGGTATQRSGDTLASVVAECDALYVTRVQRERFESQALYERTKGSYVVDAALMRTAKATCAILHPLPRVDEIATDVDALPNAAYFRQMEHGLYARMALLDLVLGRPSMLDGLRAALGL